MTLLLTSHSTAELRREIHAAWLRYKAHRKRLFPPMFGSPNDDSITYLWRDGLLFEMNMTTREWPGIEFQWHVDKVVIREYHTLMKGKPHPTFTDSVRELSPVSFVEYCRAWHDELAPDGIHYPQHNHYPHRARERLAFEYVASHAKRKKSNDCRRFWRDVIWNAPNPTFEPSRHKPERLVQLSMFGGDV